MPTKHDRMAALVVKRRQSDWGYKQPGDIFPEYECDYVSPYSKAGHNLNARVFVLLQDWGSEESLGRRLDDDSVNFGYSKNVPTNINLFYLLDEYLGISISDTYATNLFPFIKPRGMSEKISFQKLRRAAVEFAIPQIDIVSPALVICLGLPTFRAVAYGLDAIPVPTRIADAIANPIVGHASLPHTQIWCQAHPGRLGQMTRNRRDSQQVANDWANMARVCGYPRPAV